MLESSQLKLAVRTMVLFEVSFIDIALLMAITVLVILYVTLLLRLKPSTETTIDKPLQRKPPTQEPATPPTTQPELSVEKQERPERSIVPEETPESKISVKIPETPEEPPEQIETPTMEQPMESTETPESKEETLESIEETPPSTSLPECPHYFGYLRKLPKNLPIPDECLGCLRIVECLHSSPV